MFVTISALICLGLDSFKVDSNIFKDNDSENGSNAGEDDFKPDNDEFNPSEDGFNPGGDGSGDDSGDDRFNKGSNKDKDKLKEQTPEDIPEKLDKGKGKAKEETPEDIPEKLDKGKGKAKEETPEESPTTPPEGSPLDSDPGYEDRRLTKIALEQAEKVGESSKPLYIPLPSNVDLPKQGGELSEQGGDLSEKGGQLSEKGGQLSDQGGESFKPNTDFDELEERLKNAKSGLEEYEIAEELRKKSTRSFNDIMQKIDEDGDSIDERERVHLLDESMKVRGIVDAATQHANHLKSQLNIPSEVEESDSEEYGESSGEEPTDVNSSDKEESRPSKRPRN
jgi:hypothetical protein